MTIKHVNNGQITMRYELAGPENAPVVCLNHCFASGLGYWDFHLAAFAGIRVLRYDMRGHGGSDTPPGPYTLNMLAADVAGLQDALSITKVHFCGVSLGGQIAQTFALNYPDRVSSLILVNTTCEYSEEQVKIWRNRSLQAIEGGISAVHQPLMERWFTKSALDLEVPGCKYMDKAISKFSPEAFAAASSAMCDLNTTGRLAEIEVPTLVIGSQDDPGAPREITEMMARLIPKAKLSWLEPARHLSSLEHPDKFNELVRSFLLEQI